jgi:hypothetical protein
MDWKKNVPCIWINDKFLWNVRQMKWHGQGNLQQLINKQIYSNIYDTNGCYNVECIQMSQEMIQWRDYYIILPSMRMSPRWLSSLHLSSRILYDFRILLKVAKLPLQFISINLSPYENNNFMARHYENVFIFLLGTNIAFSTLLKDP